MDKNTTKQSTVIKATFIQSGFTFFFLLIAVNAFGQEFLTRMKIGGTLRGKYEYQTQAQCACERQWRSQSDGLL